MKTLRRTSAVAAILGLIALLFVALAVPAGAAGGGSFSDFLSWLLDWLYDFLINTVCPFVERYLGFNPCSFFGVG